MANKIFLFFLFLSFVLGQFARVQFGNGISVTLLDCTVFFFFFSNAIRLIRMDNKERSVIANTTLFKPLLIFYVACLLSLIFNISSLQTNEFMTSGLYLLRFVFYSSIIFFIPFFAKKQQKKLILALAGSVLVAVGIGFVQFIYYPNLRNLFYLGWDDHLYRLFSVYLDPNFASVLFSFVFIFLLGKMIRIQNDDQRKPLLGILAFFSVLAVFFTYSRTGMITLLTGMTVLLLLTGYKKLIFILAGGFLLLLFLTADVKVEGLNPFRTASSSARIESMRIAIAIFEKQPLFGVGFNAYRYAQHRYGFRPDGAWETSHADAGTDNSFLFVLATTGLVGFGSYIYVWYVMLRTSFIAARHKNTYFPIIVFSTLIAALVSSLFLNTLFYPFILVWVFSLFAVKENTSL